MKNEISNKEEAKRKLKKHLKNMAVKKKPYVAETADKQGGSTTTRDK